MTRTPDEIREHYSNARDVYESLAYVGDYETIAAPDNTAWYITDDHGDIEALDNGYDRRGRPMRLGADIDQALSETDRVFYAITSYKDTDALTSWEYFQYGDDGMDWRADIQNPLPEYSDIRAVPAWGDVDLSDRFKGQRGELDDETVKIVEETLQAYVDAFADLYGSRDAVFALDSVGGAYVFGAPAATLPIAEHFGDDPGTLQRVMTAVVNRSNEWLKDRQAEIEAEIRGAEHLIDPDWVNNKNRQYKAPLSLHKSHDAVVTPLDTSGITYDLTPFDSVDDALLSKSKEWAENLTSVAHTDCVASLVENLWPEYTADYDSWRAALDAWVADERASEIEDEFDGGDADGPGGVDYNPAVEGAPITPRVQDVYDAVSDIPVEDVAEETVVYEWTDNASGLTDRSGSNKRAFVPMWGRNANSGNANYVDTAKNVWNDSGNGDHGTVVELALLGADGENWTRGKIAQSADWHRGVAYLREMGYDIPVFTPDAETADADKMPFWAVKEAAVALGVLPRDAFIERENDDDSETYLGFPGHDSYETALDEIEKAGLTHGRRTKEERLAKNRITSILKQQENADEDDDELSGDDKETIADSAGKLTDEDYEEIADDIADVLGRTRHALDRHRALYRQQQYDHVFVENHKVKRIKRLDNGWCVTDVLLDFDLDVQRFVRSPDANGATMVDVHVIPSQSPSTEYDKTVEPGVFNEPRKFKNNIMDQVFGTTIPVERSERDVINEIRLWIDRQDVPVVQGQKEMGLSSSYDEFVLPNGTITGDGWTEDPDTVFVDNGFAVSERVELDPNQHSDYDEDAVAEMLELVTGTRIPERGLPVFGWFYATPYERRIMDETGEYSPLSVSATSGAGKSALLGALNGMFGLDGQPNDLEDTPWAFSTKFLASRGVPMWFDEFKRVELSDNQLDRLNRHMKTASRGGIMDRGNQDLSTDGMTLMSPVVLSGEDQLDGSAVERRAIMPTLLERATEEGSDERDRFMNLVGSDFVEDGEVQVAESEYPLTDHALAYYSFVAGTNDDEFESDWMNSKRYVAEKLHEWGHSGELGDMEKQGLQTVVFGFKRLRAFAEFVGADLDKLPDRDDLDDALQHIAQVGEDKRLDDMDRYVQLLGRAFVNGDLEEDTHLRVVKEGRADEQLRVNINVAHDKITKYVGDHRADVDMLSQAKDYKQHFEEAADRSDSYVVVTSQPTTGINRAVGIDMRQAEEEIPGFDRAVFVDDGDDSDGKESVSSDSDDGDGGSGGDDELSEETTAVDSVTDSPTGFVDVTVEVIDVNAGDGPPARATVKDVTGTITLIDFNDAPVFDVIDEGGTYLVKDLEVGEYDGKTQLQTCGGSTAEHVQQGVGHTPGDDPGVNEQLNDATTKTEAESVEAATDGGEETRECDDDTSQRDRVMSVKDVVESVEATAEGGAAVEEVLGRLEDRGFDPEKAEKELEKLLHKGEMYEVGGGRVRTT